MCTILLSINPEHVEHIMEGTKTYEFRKNICKKKVDKIVIYSTSPVMKVVGEASVEDILIDAPDKIWKQTHDGAGIEKSFFDKYYSNKSYAVAYKLSNIIKYNSPRKLEYYGITNAPQSFCYLNV